MATISTIEVKTFIEGNENILNSMRMFNNEFKANTLQEKEKYHLECKRLHSRKQELRELKQIATKRYDESKESTLLNKMKKMSLTSQVGTLEEQIGQKQSQIKALEDEKQDKNKELEVLKQELMQHQTQLEREKQQLQIQIALYKKLGLEFRHSGTQVTVVLTQIDPKHHTKEFTFQLGLIDGDRYEISNCSLLPQQVQPLLHRLNETNDLGAFVREMRQLFKRGVF